jgi:autotransporter-associated beta strand protein
MGLLTGPGQAVAQRPLGIDVSSYQGSGVNWTNVKSSGVVFAWAKATEGTGVIDGDFTINENHGKAAGVYMGAYHFAHPNLNTPAAEAAYFWSEAGSYILADGKTLMPMLDMEVFSGVVGASTYSEWVNDWCADVIADAANAGVTVKPFIYVSACNAGYFDTSVAGWFSDIANYGAVDGDNNPQTGTPWSSCSGDDVWGSGVWTVWQYASTNVPVPGVSGACDVDVFNGTLSGLTNALLATVSGSGAIYYWDPQGTSGSDPYTGSMTGTWENNKWTGSAGGQTSPIAWVEGKAACFGVNTGTNTPAFTVTMNSNHVVAGFFDGGLTPKSCNVTITGSGVISVATGAQAFDSDNSSDGSLGLLAINTVIAGNGQLVPEGNGQTYLNGANTYSGGTALGYSTVPFSGTLNFNNGSAFGTGAITLQSVGTGGALVAEGTSAITITNSVTVASTTTNNIVGNSAGVTFSGPWSLSAAVSLGSGGAAANLVNIAGVISGTAALTKYNPGILSLNGVNPYSGPITISAGTLTIGGAGQLGSGTYANTIADAGTFNYSSTATQTLSGVISGAGALTQTAGTLILNAANTYTGYTTISGGTLQLGLANGVPAASPVFLANGATFNLNGKSESIATLGGPIGETLAAGNVINNNSTLTINGTSVSNAGTAGSGAYSGVISGSGNVLVTGGGSTTFSGSNIYGGATTVSGGTLVPSFNGALPSNSAVTVNNPGIFDIVSANEAIASLTGSGTVNLESGTLTVGTANTPSTFSGVIRNSPATYNNGASANGLQGFYYPNINFSGTPIIRVDATVNFSNLATNTQPLYPQVTEFSVRWIGQLLTTTAGTYTFTTTSDDGSRCWVNGQLVVDNWAFQGGTARSGTISLSAGTLYDIRVEYMQGGGGAECILNWTPPSGSSVVIPNGNLFTYAGVGGLVKAGSSTLTLSGANTYAGTTAINAGTLALASTGSINNTATLGIAAGATLDVSAYSSWTLSGSTTLSASGTSTAAAINGGATINLGSRPIILNYDGAHPALTVSQGALSLNGNAFTVNGSPLAGGVYTIVQQTSGSISGSGTFSVTGTAIPATGAMAAISITGGNVLLTITDATTTTLNALTPSTYGQLVTFTATVAPSPVGGTVQFYDNGAALGGLVAVSAGTASYGTNGLSVGNHPITASYSGALGYAASSTAGPSVQVVNLPSNSVPVTIGGVTFQSGIVQMNFIGVPGYTYLIEAATNLNSPITWTTLGSNTADINGAFSFSDSTASNYNGRYYRTATQ